MKRLRNKIGMMLIVLCCGSTASGCVGGEALAWTGDRSESIPGNGESAGLVERPEHPAVRQTEAEESVVGQASGPGCVADFCEGEPTSEPDEGAVLENVLGGALQPCSEQSLTGFFRTGSCETGPQDRGNHAVCAVMTEAFLAYTRQQGNDLSTPAPESRFPGLAAGDRWCLCAARWEQARLAGVAPLVDMAATNVSALESASVSALQAHADPAED